MSRTFNWLIICLLVAFSCVACGSSSSSDSGDASKACQQIDLPTKIINGVACGEVERSPVVRVAVSLSGGGVNLLNPICTGTMITPNQVLTAQHCIVPQDAFENYQVTSIGILHNLTEGFRYIPARKIDLMPGYGAQGDRVFNDVAILTLTQDVSLPTVPVLVNQNPEIGGQGWVFGYGQTEIGTEVSEEALNFVELNAGPMKIENVTPNHVFVQFNGSGTNVCFGDSGGPLMYSLNDETVIVGVVSQGSVEDCGKGDVTTFAKLSEDSARTWLTQVAPAAALR